MDKISFMRLWDLYHGLLTSTRREITDLYLNFDLTVSEIAEQKSISRQGVSDCIKACEKQLEEFENKLKFAKLSEKYALRESFVLSGVSRWAENFKTAHPELGGEIGELMEIINTDFCDEAERALKSNKVELWQYSRLCPKD